MKKLISAASGLGVWAAAAAHAGPTPGGIALQRANSALAEEVHFFHNGILMPIITAICLLVLSLLLWAILRYNRRANPSPRKFSHNTLVEVVWTGVPILILLVIALPSFELLYKEDIMPDGKQSASVGDGRTTDFVFENDFESASRRVTRPDHLQVIVGEGDDAQLLKHRDDYSVEGLGEEEITVSLNTAPAAGERVVIRGGRSVFGRGDDREIALAPSMTLKVTGYQWGWSYSYPEFGDFEFLSNMLAEDQTTPELYRFETDNHVVVPVGETVRVTTTSRDVIHSWAMPAFAIKIDAVPGRINETWFRADREGVYYGQCSEICGVRHSFMPIAVEVVSIEEFCGWVETQQSELGVDRTPEDIAAQPLCNNGQGGARMADAGAAAQ